MEIEPFKARNTSSRFLLPIFRRVDVEQAAVAPLMAALIGAPFPLNSVGILPVEYLAFSEDALAASLLANLKQIMALTRRYHGRVESVALIC